MFHVSPVELGSTLESNTRVLVLKMPSDIVSGPEELWDLLTQQTLEVVPLQNINTAIFEYVVNIL